MPGRTSDDAADIVEAIGARGERTARLEAKIALHEVFVHVFDVRRVAGDNVIAFAADRREPVAVVERDAQPERARVARCDLERRLARIHGMHGGVRALLGDGQCDGTAAGTEIKHAAAHWQASEHQLHEQLGFRPRDQRGRCHFQRQRPEVAPAGDVGHGLPGRAARHEGLEAFLTRWVQLVIRVGEEPGAVHAQRMRQQGLGLEAVAQGVAGGTQDRADIGHRRILAGGPAYNARMRPLLIAVALLCLTACRATFFASINASQSAEGVVSHPGLVYDPAHQLALDVYAPVHADHAPVVVYFYGGDWQQGKRQWDRWMGEALARDGIVAVVPDIRLWPLVPMAGFLGDAANAVRWVRDHIGEFGGAPGDMFLMGHSSGGHIAAMLATDKQWLGAVGMQPRDLAGWIGVAGAYDFLPIDDDADYVGMFGKTPAEQAASQPVNFVDGDEPPALLLQGEKDTEVYPTEALSMAARYNDAAEPAELKLYPGAGHEGLLLSFGPMKHRASALADTVDFIRHHPAH
jgi:acetyl esterase/lipase